MKCPARRSASTSFSSISWSVSDDRSQTSGFLCRTVGDASPPAQIHEELTMQPCSAAASRPSHRRSGLLAGASILGLLALPAVPASAQYAAVVRSAAGLPTTGTRSEEHTSELQSLMRISYAVFCLKNKKQQY